MNPRLFVFFAFVGFCVFRKAECGMSLEQIENVGKGMRKSCLSKVPIDAQMAENVKKGEFPDDQNFKCYIRCIVKMSKGIKNGKIDETMVIAQISMFPINTERLIAGAKKCVSVTSDNECDLAYQFIKCQYDADPEVFFFP